MNMDDLKDKTNEIKDQAKDHFDQAKDSIKDTAHNVQRDMDHKGGEVEGRVEQWRDDHKQDQNVNDQANSSEAAEHNAMNTNHPDSSAIDE